MNARNRSLRVFLNVFWLFFLLPFTVSADDSPVTILLRLKATDVRVMAPSSLDALSNRLEELDASGFEPVFPDQFFDRDLDELRILDHSRSDEKATLARWRRVSLPPGTDPEEISALLTAEPEIELAEPVYEWKLHDAIPPVIEGLPDATTDPDYSLQWHHEISRIVNAWHYLNTHGHYPGGRNDVVVAVIDTGVDATHPELTGNMWINSGEIPGSGKDDDGNGFIDDIHGVSVVGGPQHYSGDSSDYHGHGTHVAGVIAAQAFNEQGGCGVAFNVRIMAVRAAQPSGALSTDDVAAGILYAVNHGADVINMSFGGYQRSQLVEDALAVALNQAVLVAAAGNDGLDSRRSPLYPAALHYVIGVMASIPDELQWLTWFSNYGPHYELKAPGVSIYSTLPDSQYAAWSGTSMAAPVVSGVAALMRSYFWQRDIYSSRYLMGSMVAANNLNNGAIDAYKALTTPPTPGVSLHDQWLFDDEHIDPNNNPNGRIDAGERVHLAIEAINRSGMASDVEISLRARAQGAVIDDPYVTIPVDTVSYGDIGPFNVKDNGFTYDADGEITGVETPFVVEVDPDTPNDHMIAFEVTFTFYDGWDPENTDAFTHISRFEMPVQHGRNVPTVIESGTTVTLDQDSLWIVSGPVLVEADAVLRITEGTRVQWGAISSDPYNPGPQEGNIVVRGTLDIEGTETDPVSLFPSYLVSGQRTNIVTESSGTCDMRYVRIQNPNISGIRSVQYGDLYWDRHASTIDIQWVSNTRFGKFRGGGSLSVGRADTCLFDAGWLNPGGGSLLYNSTFLQDNENKKRYSLTAPLSFRNPLTNTKGDLPFWSTPETFNGYTYVLLPMERVNLRLAEAIASFYGGHVASVRDSDESDFLKSYVNQHANFRRYGAANRDWVYIGLANWEDPSEFVWLDGNANDFTDWADGHPADLDMGRPQLVQFLEKYDNGYTLVWDWRTVYQSDSIRTGHGDVSSWKSFVLRLPGEWSREALNAPVENGDLLTHVRQTYEPEWGRNAFLSAIWDPQVAHWMRVQGTSGAANGYCIVPGNYWGTDNMTLIDHMIEDYYDDFTSARVEYGDSSGLSHASTWPFVVSVTVNGQPVETVPTLGAGETVFEITFNRDMNPDIEPFVTFGPSPPFTDFEVRPVDSGINGWQDARTWRGSFYIVPVTGEGYHQMRISGAAAADDGWLVSGYDVGRFRFRVEAMGVAAMHLHAVGQEGAINLNWLQDDYELIAGYNLYRSSSLSGPFTQLNPALIPVEKTHYIDSDVIPGEAMYYRFTVVLTDFSESDFSNIASAEALDTVPPVIQHSPPSSAAPGLGLRIAAQITDNVGVQGATLHYRCMGEPGDYSTISLVNVQEDEWSANIPGSAVEPPGVAYYLTATDGVSTTYKGTPATPYMVTVEDQPAVTAVSPVSGPAAGGTQVTISGMRFEPGASVQFGGAPASDVTVLTASQIQCTTPPHLPTWVDVMVTNPDDSNATLLKGFQYVADGAVLSLPTMDGDYGSFVEVPLSSSNVDGLLAVDITVAFDPAVLNPVSVSTGSLTYGWALAENLENPGLAILSMASPTAVSGEGGLAIMQFEVIGEPLDQTPLEIISASLNDGAQPWHGEDGIFSVSGLFSISGLTVYYGSDQVVPNVDIQLTGSGLHSTSSDQEGIFNITGVSTGSYSLKATKTNDVNAITAYDAALVLAASAGLSNLDDHERIAADVNRSGAVTAMDASLILQKAVGLLDLPFPGAGLVWDFVPAERDYPLLNDDQTDQNFTAILLGDVAGDWVSPAEPSPQGMSIQGEIEPSTGSDSVRVALNWVPIPGTNQSMVRLLSQAEMPAVQGVDVTFSYDQEHVNLIDWYSDYMIAVNNNEPGIITAGLANAVPLAKNAVLASFIFEGGLPPGVIIENISFNADRLDNIFDECVAVFDTDGDGLLDIDEIEIFNSDPLKWDTSGDGMSDGDKVVAGLDPTDEAERFEVWLMDVETYPGQVALCWQSAPGRVYTVYEVDLETSRKEKIATIAGDGNVLTYIVSDREGRIGLYKIGVRYADPPM